MNATPAAAPTTAAPTRRSSASDLAAFGLLLTVLVAVVHFVASALTGTSFAENSLFLVVAAIPLLTAVAIYRSGATWTNVLGLVVTVILVLFGFWIAFGLTFLASPVEFTTAVAFVLGIVFSAVGNTRALRERRGRVAPVSSALLRTVVVGTAVGLGFALTLSSGVALTTGSSVAPEEAAGAQQVTMRGMAFTETAVEVPADEPVRLLVSNDDPFVHDIVIEELGVDAVLSPGDEVLVDLTAPAGSYTVYCTLHSDTSVADPVDKGMATRLVATG